MVQTYPELPIDGVLLAPFVIYAVAALGTFLLLRPALRLVGFDRLFSNPPAAHLSVYVVILALLVASS